MPHPRWQRVEELYHAALERQLESRVSFLKEVCPDDDLRREVESLACHESGDILTAVPSREGQRLRPGCGPQKQLRFVNLDYTGHRQRC